MAKLEYTLTFDASILKKIIKETEANLFIIIIIIIQDNFSELEYLLNINDISESEL